MTGSERRKLNRNAGFSLVELLIAVVILAIIVIPLLHLFISSTRVNVKSRKTLRATTVAQDIMEGLKAYNIDELKTQFNDPEEGFYVINDKLIKGNIREEASLEDEDGSGDPDEGLYCFSMSNVSMQGSKYDALITVDGRGYMAPLAGTSDPSAHDQELNSSGIAKIGSIKKNVDGVYSEGIKHYNYIDLKEECTPEEYESNESLKYRKEIQKVGLDKIWNRHKIEFEARGLTRKDLTYRNLNVSKYYTVDIKDSGSVDKDGNVIADVETTVELEYSTGYVSGTVEAKKDYTDFSSGNFYFLYYPLYNAGDESITVNNPDHLPFCMYIIKQIDSKTPDKMTDAQLTLAEKNYYVEVEVVGGDNDKIQIRTNLGWNLVNEQYLSAEGDAKEVPGQATFLLGSSKMNVFTLSGKRNTTLGLPGTGSEVTEFIYDVHVAVYQEGAAAKGFPDEDRMVTIDGSMYN